MTCRDDSLSSELLSDKVDSLCDGEGERLDRGFLSCHEILIFLLPAVVPAIGNGDRVPATGIGVRGREGPARDGPGTSIGD